MTGGRRSPFRAGRPVAAIALTLGLLPCAAIAAPVPGINLAGGEFNSGRKPGVYAKDYVYPNGRIAADFLKMGMKMVRVPILWERVQPVAMQPLSEREMKLLDKSLASLSGFETIIIDVHNYGKLNGQRLDQMPDGARKLADLWSRLASHYRDDRRIAFGLMNEPNGTPPHAWRKIADASVAAIRKTGARNLILVPGSNWSGAHSWTRGGPRSNAAAFKDFRDPANNYVLEMHQYLDADSSGMTMRCQPAEVITKRMSAATNWLRATGQKAVLGEFGAPADPQCLDSLDALLDHMSRNGDAWMGWTYWAGGGWWGANYPMSVQPLKGKRRPQAAVLARHIHAAGGRK